MGLKSQHSRSRRGIKEFKTTLSHSYLANLGYNEILLPNNNKKSQMLLFELKLINDTL